MTYKRAIAIGLLTSLGIGLLVFGIKTGTFKKQNIGKITTPISYNLNKKRNAPLHVDADDILPISTKWLLNKSISNYQFQQTSTNATYWTKNNEVITQQTTSTLKFVNENYIGSSYYTKYGWKLSTSSNRIYQKAITSSSSADLSGMFVDNANRLFNFTNEPTGNIYTFLSHNAQPAYNNDVIIYSGEPTRTIINENYTWNRIIDNKGIQQIRKSNIILTEEQITDGAFINESAPIDIYLDAGITHLYINGTDHINSLDTQLNITNDDIVIQATGTTTGQYWKTFRINYFNTRPAITPQPYPDASGKVTEVLDITGLMFQILTMPFTFISQAFNLTLWEGTPYQFNFSNFILSLIAIATIIFIIKLFTSGFSVIGNYTSHRADTKLKRSQTKLNKAKTKEIESKTPKKE